MRLRVGLSVILLAFTGCGGSQHGLLGEAQTAKAFRGAGLYQGSGLIALFDGQTFGTKVTQQSWDSQPRSMSPSVVVELFPSVPEARQVMAIGWNIETNKGVPIHPLARVANVIVTLYPDASPEDRSRASMALVSLRRK
jgi:hypothetical protein